MLVMSPNHPVSPKTLAIIFCNVTHQYVNLQDHHVKEDSKMISKCFTLPKPDYTDLLPE